MFVSDNVRLFCWSKKKYHPQKLLKECKYEVKKEQNEKSYE